MCQFYACATCVSGALKDDFFVGTYLLIAKIDLNFLKRVCNLQNNAIAPESLFRQSVWLGILCGPQGHGMQHVNVTFKKAN